MTIHLVTADAVTSETLANVGVGFTFTSEGRETESNWALYVGTSRRAALIRGIILSMGAMADRIASGDTISILTVADRQHIFHDDGSCEEVSAAIKNFAEGITMLHDFGVTIEIGQANGQEVKSLGEATRLSALGLMAGNTQMASTSRAN